MKIRALVILVLFSCILPAFAEQKIRVGVQTTLSGDGANFGTDIRNALNFANERYCGNRYEFIFEDDRCSAQGGVTVANKLATSDKVPYVLGVACNEPLLAAAPIYQRNKTVVISPFATTGDKVDVGDHIFRLFPADNIGAELLYKVMAKAHNKIAIYTEQNEYPALMERTFVRMNREAAEPRKLIQESWLPSNYDHRTVLLKMLSASPEGIFVNANAEASFMPVVKQLRDLRYSGTIYSVYWAASDTTIKQLGSLNEGVVVVSTPMIESALTDEGKGVYTAFVKKYGKPGSIGLGIALSIDSLRMLDMGLKSGKPLPAFLRGIKFQGLLGKLTFDKFGAVEGIGFEVQKIENGAVKRLDSDL